MVTKHIFIMGKVQGVGFRFQAKLKADELELLGWIRNLDDGRVELVVRGDDSKVNQLVKWIQAGGPPSAKVEKVDIGDGSEKDIAENFKLNEFYIRRGD